MSRDPSSEVMLYALVGGPFLLAWGLKTLQKKRVLENIPTAKARSAHLGLVELSGVAQPRKLTNAPVSGVPCCWWKIEIQKLVSSGRRRAWRTVHEASTPDPLYLEDSTGRVLVDPTDAELHVDPHVFKDNSAGVSQALASLGFAGAGSFFGPSMRAIETRIPPMSPLYAIGELALRKDQLASRRERFAARMIALKNHPDADADHDGTITPQEWEEFRLKQEKLFLEEEARAAAAVPEVERTILRKPADGPFIVATKPELGVRRTLAWKSALAIPGGILGSAIGVSIAIHRGFSEQSAGGLLALGAAAGVALAAFGSKFAKLTRRIG